MVDTLLRGLIFLLVLWQLMISCQQWKMSQAALKRLGRQQRKKKTRSGPKPFSGLTKKPVCEACVAENAGLPQPEQRREPPPLIEQKRGRQRKVETGHHYCPKPKCQYYGWLNRGNISSNGHPNGGRSRQLYCRVCDSYFAETKGTLFYGKRYRPEQIGQALSALAEGLGIRAVGRVFGVEPDTILDWLLAASQHGVAFTDYLVRDLELEQVQLDELFGIVRAVEAGQLDRTTAIEQLDRPWLWTAMDPVSKFWLATKVGPRRTALAQQLIHQLVKRLKTGQVPLFLTDGYPAYETALLSHFGHWLEPAADSSQRKPRWWPLPQLHYVQVIKKRICRRLVSVSKRLVFGSWPLVQQRLAASGWQVNTAFIERLNLSIRQHVPGLGRRVNTLALSPTGLVQQVTLFQLYYNFCLPQAALKVALKNNHTRQKWQQRSPAMAVGLTDHLWSLGEVLAFRVPPWPQELG